jgi:hypothetical protein
MTEHPSQFRTSEAMDAAGIFSVGSKDDNTAFSSLTDAHYVSHSISQEESTSTVVSSDCSSSSHGVAHLRGWLDGKSQQQQQKQPYDKSANNNQRPVSKRFSLSDTVLHNTNASKASKELHQSTNSNSSRRQAATPIRIKPKFETTEVEATDQGYASVAKLSAWLADDPTSNKKRVTQLRRGANVIAKSRTFDKGLANVIVETSTIRAGHVKEQRQSLGCRQGELTSPMKAQSTVGVGAVSSINVGKQKEWLSNAFKTQTGGGRAQTEVITRDSDMQDITLRAKQMWRVKQTTPPRHAVQQHETGGCLSKEIAPTEFGTKSHVSELFDEAKLTDTVATTTNQSFAPSASTAPFPAPALKPSSYKAQKMYGFTPPRMNKSAYNLKTQQQQQLQQFNSSFLSLPTCNFEDSIASMPEAVTASCLAEMNIPWPEMEESACSVIKPNVGASNQLDNYQPTESFQGGVWSKADAPLLSPSFIAKASQFDVSEHFMLRDIEAVDTATTTDTSEASESDHPMVCQEDETACLALAASTKKPDFKLDMIVRPYRSQRSTDQRATDAKVSRTPEFQKVHLRSSCLERGKKEIEIDEDMGPVGFHAARASFLARLNPPKPVEPDDSIEFDPDAPVDFRRARDALVKRARKNGNPTEVMTKINRRKQQFERIGNANSKRRSSLSSASVSATSLRRAPLYLAPAAY